MNKIPELLDREFYSQIDGVMNSKAGEKQIFSFDRVELHLNPMNETNWEKDLPEQLLREIEDYLDKHVYPGDLHHGSFTPDPMTSTSYEEKAEELILYYIRHGYLPENNLSKDLLTVLRRLKLSDPFFARLLSLFSLYPYSLKRFFYNLEEEFIRQVLRYFLIEKSKIMEAWVSGFPEAERRVYLRLIEIILLSDLLALRNPDRIETIIQIAWDMMTWTAERGLIHLQSAWSDLEVLFKKRKNLSPTLTRILEMIPGDTANPEPKQNPAKRLSEEKEQPLKAEDHRVRPADPIFIPNGGLVLLSGFLPEFFRHLNYIGEDAKFIAQAQNRAALLLQYTISGQEKIFENELPLNKILCGIKLEEVVPTPIVFTEEEKAESEKLLSSLIRHWTILKNTSIPTLRESFLMRPAKLEMKNEAYVLFVENRGIDILLDRFPMSYSYIYHRWMEYPLEVHWH